MALARSLADSRGSERAGEVPGLRRARTLRAARRVGTCELTLILALDS
jgi:hypothetical protein